MHGTEMQQRMQPCRKYLRLQKQTRLSAKAEISILQDLYYNSQYSPKIQILPINDFENGKTRLQNAAHPFWRSRTAIATVCDWQHPCSRKETMCAKCFDTKLSRSTTRRTKCAASHAASCTAGCEAGRAANPEVAREPLSHSFSRRFIPFHVVSQIQDVMYVPSKR